MTNSINMMNQSINMNRVKLHNNNKERDYYDNLANLYAIIRTMEGLEKAYANDSIEQEEYKIECGKLIAQFRTAKRCCGLTTGEDIRKFMLQYNLDCNAAYHRLVEVGIPDVGEVGGDAKYIAETVQHFITLMDSLKLKMVAVDEIQPLVGDLLESLNKVSNLPNDFEGKIKIQNWFTLLNTMRATDELNEDQSRQMFFDLENAHLAFYRSLDGKEKKNV